MQQYIIDFVDSATEDEINQYLSAYGATVLKTFSAFEKVVLVECASEPLANDIVEHIKDDNHHTNHIKLLTTVPIQFPSLPEEGAKTIVTADQKDWWKVYSGSVVDLDSSSFQLPLSGAGATVYMMDSGIMAEHPEFEGADIEFLYSLNDDFVDRKGHGTGLSSLIVGKTCGITNAKLKVVKIFDKDVPTRLSDFLSALDAIYTDFSQVNTYGVINCSWEIERNEYVESKLRTLWISGVQIVVAAGNTSTEIGNVTPAAMPEALVVGAYNASLEPCDFSDYTGAQAISVTGGTVNGGKLSGWAPGENIYVATLDGAYSFVSGTSVSAAIHSAILAYNVTLPTFKFDNTVNSLFNISTLNRMTFFIKKDLLLLDDPKYQNSPNLVSYLITDLEDPYQQHYDGVPRDLYAAFLTTVVSRIILFNPLRISSVTVNDPLPYNFTINNYGILSGYVETINGEQEDYDVSLTVTDVDGNVTEEELRISIYHNPDYVPNKSDPNPFIPYALNFNCEGLNFCAGSCGGEGCFFPSICVCGKSSICECE
jgi:subtilisin family serine protease